MRLIGIQLRSFRCFVSSDIDFRPVGSRKLTVILSENGGGKTALVDAASSSLGLFAVAADLPLAETCPILHSDARIDVRPIIDPANQSIIGFEESASQYPVTVRARIEVQDETFEVRRSLNMRGSQFNEKKDGIQATRTIVAALGRAITPLVARYPTHRFARPVVVSSDEAESPLPQQADDALAATVTSGGIPSQRDALRGAFSRHLEWEPVRLWWAQRELRRRQQGIEDPHLEVVEQVLADVLNLSSRPLYDFDAKDVVFNQPHTSRWLPFWALPDGYRVVGGLVADIARRCCLANPSLGRDVLRVTPGVVIIDEVDLHLHPVWQRTILASLCNAFPEVHFVVTTHSSLVVSSVSDEEVVMLGQDPLGTIRRLRRDEAGKLSVDGTHQIDPRILQSSEVLEQYFLLEDGSQPQAYGEALRRYVALAQYQMRNEHQQAELEQLKASLVADRVGDLIEPLPRLPDPEAPSEK